MTNILKEILNRRSYRSFSHDPVEKEKLEAIATAALCSPSARHQQGWRFIVVTNQEKIDQLSQMKTGAEFIAQAPAAIIIVSNDWKHWVEDASIAAGYIYLEATHQGLGTCWVNVYDNSSSDNPVEKHVREAVSLSEEERVLCIMPIGYPAEFKDSHQPQLLENEKVSWID
jgi:nitroreductase